MARSSYLVLSKMTWLALTVWLAVLCVVARQFIPAEAAPRRDLRASPRAVASNAVLGKVAPHRLRQEQTGGGMTRQDREIAHALVRALGEDRVQAILAEAFGGCELRRSHELPTPPKTCAVRPCHQGHA
jgi:hypothetical protein